MEIMFDTITTISTCLGLIGLLYQYWQQNKINKFELIMNLYRELFLNEKFMRITNIIDNDSLNDRNNAIQRIIQDDHGIDPDQEKISESDLVSFLNFFNSLAILAEQKVLSKNEILDVFHYQIEKLFTTITLIKYIEEYGFDRIKKIVPDTFFFYGSLSDKIKRSTITEITAIREALVDEERNVKLDDYSKVENIRPDLPYPVIVKSNGNHCRGNLVKLSEKASWYEVFNVLDDYEEIFGRNGAGPLYKRRIVKLETGSKLIISNKKKRFVWTYVN